MLCANVENIDVFDSGCSDFWRRFCSASTHAILTGVLLHSVLHNGHILL